MPDEQATNDDMDPRDSYAVDTLVPEASGDVGATA